jgi:hypothetical protein
MNFKDWLKNEIVGIYPPLYDGLAAYPDGYFVNSSYKVYINASLKAKTNPPQLIKENNEKIDFISFSKTGEIKVLVNGIRRIFIVDGLYIERFRQSSQADPARTYQQLKDWVEKGLAQEI